MNEIDEKKKNRRWNIFMVFFIILLVGFIGYLIYFIIDEFFLKGTSPFLTLLLLIGIVIGIIMLIFREKRK